jgi:hypothetical protein
MKVTTANELHEKRGKLVLIYGEAGVGKTTSCFESLPKPLAYIRTEPRDPGDSIRAAKSSYEGIDIMDADNWMDLLNTLRKFEKFDKYNSVVLDSLSYLMNVSLTTEIEMEAFESREEKEKKLKPIVSSAKMSLEGFGGLSSQMNRLMNLLGKLSAQGKIVVITCLLSENPKWNRDISAGPALKGKEFPNNLPSYCDLIGMVQTRYDDEGRKLFPPLVSFEGVGFTNKFTGVLPPGAKAIGPLDFRKILRVAEKGGVKEA